MGYTRYEDNREVWVGSNGLGYSNVLLTPDDLLKIESLITDNWWFYEDPPLMIGQDHKVQDESTRKND